MTQICVFNTRLLSLHNTLNYAIHRAFLRMVLLTDVYRNLTSLWIKPWERAFKQFKSPILNVLNWLSGKLLLICIFRFISQAMSEATFWFTTVITVIILMIPVLAWRFYFVDVCPTLSDRVRLKQRLAQLRYVPSLVFVRAPRSGNKVPLLSHIFVHFQC